MIETFRLGSVRRMVSGIKTAESGKGNLVHVMVHCFGIVLQKCLDKVVVCRRIIFKPAFYHILKHKPYFFVREFQTIFFFARIEVKCMFFHFKISAGKQQAPYGVLIVVKLVKDDLLIYFCLEYAAV